MAQMGVTATPQYLQNSTFDPAFGVFAFELLAYDPVADAMKRVTIDAMSHYGTNDVDNNANGTIYEGLESADGGWQIVEITTSGTVTSNRFATQKNNNSVTTYADAWTARTTTLSYGTYSEAF